MELEVQSYWILLFTELHAWLWEHYIIFFHVLQILEIFNEEMDKVLYAIVQIVSKY